MKKLFLKNRLNNILNNFTLSDENTIFEVGKSVLSPKEEKLLIRRLNNLDLQEKEKNFVKNRKYAEYNGLLSITHCSVYEYAIFTIYNFSQSFCYIIPIDKLTKTHKLPNSNISQYELNVYFKIAHAISLNCNKNNFVYDSNKANYISNQYNFRSSIYTISDIASK